MIAIQLPPGITPGYEFITELVIGDKSPHLRMYHNDDFNDYIRVDLRALMDFIKVDIDTVTEDIHRELSALIED